MLKSLKTNIIDIKLLHRKRNMFNKRNINLHKQLIMKIRFIIMKIDTLLLRAQSNKNRTEILNRQTGTRMMMTRMKMKTKKSVLLLKEKLEVMNKIMKKKSNLEKKNKTEKNKIHKILIILSQVKEVEEEANTSNTEVEISINEKEENIEVEVNTEVEESIEAEETIEAEVITK